MRGLVTGATGLVGRNLVPKLDRAVILSRDPSRVRSRFGSNTPSFLWSPEQGLPPSDAFSDIDVVFHLAGEPIAEGRWTTTKKQKIRDSRVVGTRNLVKALETLNQRPSVLVVASAVGFYGDRSDEILTESSQGASTFLSEVCTQWEQEAQRANELGMRVVVARLGIVLAPEGGALSKMMPTFRLGLGGPLGNGKQWMSWIHIDDAIELLFHAARSATISGPLNVVSPSPVSNKTFTRTLAHTLHRPAILRVPRIGLQTVLGEFSGVLLESQRVLPNLALKSGFRFKYEKLESALEACSNRSTNRESK